MIMAGMCASAISAAEEKKVENKKVNYQTYAAELDKTAIRAVTSVRFGLKIQLLLKFGRLRLLR